jgi:HPt (histidine-containing phosphotransfer) domain-containing protein
MSFEKAIEASLATVLGDDHALLSELRGAFAASARGHVETLRDTVIVEDWQDAALRLKGLAASFGATALMQAAGRAAKSACGDPNVLAALETELAAFDI